MFKQAKKKLNIFKKINKKKASSYDPAGLLLS